MILMPCKRQITFLGKSYEPNFIYSLNSSFEELKRIGSYDFSIKPSLKVKINYITVCKILETSTEGNLKYSRKNVKI